MLFSRDGNLPDIGRAGSLHEFLLDLHEEYGPIASFWMGQRLVLSIASPELFKEHLAVFDRPRKLVNNASRYKLWRLQVLKFNILQVLKSGLT